MSPVLCSHRRDANVETSVASVSLPLYSNSCPLLASCLPLPTKLAQRWFVVMNISLSLIWLIIV